MSMKITHVIFDLDGLLLDTESIFEQCYTSVINEYGKQYDWDLQSQVMGKSAEQGVEIILEKLNLPLTVEEYLTKVREICKTTLPDAKLLPGSERLVRHLHHHNIPIAVATSSSNSSCDIKLQKHKEFISLFHHLVSAENPDVKHAKPFPDLFLVCTSKFTNPPTPDKVLVLEDSPSGVEAAIAAGMAVVMVPDRRLDPALTTKATVVLKSLEDFCPENFGLPPYD